MYNTTMTSKAPSFLHSLAKNPFTVFLVLVVGGLVAWSMLRGTPASPYQTVTVEPTELAQEVSVTGKVKAITSADLSFAAGGRIASVSARVGNTVVRGQTLVTLENRDVAANLEQALASLKAAEAKLDELVRGTRPEEIAITEAKVASSRQALIVELQSAYASADASIQVELDQFISNPHGANPQLSFSTADSSVKTALESGRATIEAPLKAWSAHASLLTTASNLSVATAEAQTVLQQVSTLLASAAAALNRAIPNGSVPQTTLDSYAVDIAAGRTSIANAISSVSIDTAALTTAELSLALEKAGTDPQDIAVQRATVGVATAKVAADKALLAKTVLSAPFSGVVTRQEAKVGQVVGQTVGTISLVTLMSSSGFEIETFVPEADIAKISIGDLASVTLDAYGEDTIFGAEVASIDPAETVIEGVSTYKVTLAFSDEPKPARSGMTANVDIKTALRSNVIAVPSRTVAYQDGKKTVKILNADGTVEVREVTTGLSGSDGRVEIVSGVLTGEKVIIFSEK